VTGKAEVAPTRRPATTATALTSQGRELLQRRLVALRLEIADLGPQLADPELERRLDDHYDRLVQEAHHLDEVLAQATGVPAPADPGVVALGSHVEVTFPGAGVERLWIVDPAEAVLDDERVSARSPVALALLGRRAGDSVQVITPRGTVTCTVVTVTHDAAPHPRAR
jgi:transcription elongation factor GreA